ncbi:MAG: cation transporter [archaeon]|nr:cation transporter [archaeon]
MKKIFKISGMHCASCSKIIEMELEGKVNSSKIDSLSGKAIIDFDEKKITEKQIKEIVIKAGYKIS